MSVYMLDVARFCPQNPPTNVRHARYIVFGEVRDDVPDVHSVLTLDAERVFVSEWLPAERVSLFEEMRKAERRFVPLMAVALPPGRIA